MAAVWSFLLNSILLILATSLKAIFLITFEEYLVQKKIDPIKFKEAEQGRYKEFEHIFSQVHPNSFTIQKLNLINFIRRQYPLKVSDQKENLQDNTQTNTKSIPRPVFKKRTP